MVVDRPACAFVNGSFYTTNEEFYIKFEAYDIQNWEQLVKRQIFCPIHDIICVHDAFLIAIESSISPFLADQLDLEATILALEREEKKATSHHINEEARQYCTNNTSYLHGNSS